MRIIPKARFTPSESKKEEVLNPIFKIAKVEQEHDRVVVWGILENGKSVQVAIPQEVFDRNELILRSGNSVRSQGLIVIKKEQDPFFMTKEPVHRLKRVKFEEHESAPDKVGEFDESFFAEQKCEAFGIDYDGMDNDCDDCMFSARCLTDTQKLAVDVIEHLTRVGKKRPTMIEKVPSWKDVRPMKLIGHGTSGEVTYDGYHRCKVCNGNVRIMLLAEGDENWQYSSEAPTRWIGNVTTLDYTDNLECPHCEVGLFKVEKMKEAAKA